MKKTKHHTEFTDSIDKQVQQKIKARKEKDRNVWFGLGMFGLVGWSIVVPTVAGIALGLWLDKQWPGRMSWTLTLMLAGVMLGCLNAWRWIGEETRDD